MAQVMEAHENGVYLKRKRLKNYIGDYNNTIIDIY